jgi:5-methylcytosine-specific restriction endonuclease McrA
MNNYIRTWNNLILNCSFVNTYKMAWSKALVELAVGTNVKTNENTIVYSFIDVAKLCLKYYWNQTIYFDLIQGPNLKKPPEIITYTKELIRLYFNKKRSVQPERLEKVDFHSLGLSREYEVAVKNIAKTLKQDVCWRFKNLNHETYEIYQLDLNADKIVFLGKNVLALKEYSDFLFALINYRWTQMLEGFNYSPRISRKVRAVDEGKIKRGSLKKFHKYLDLETDGKPICFYCGREIVEEELSVDHVIPWSYMFSDDLWNLVYCHKGENSEKSNRLPDEEDIVRLEKRNHLLLTRMENNSKEYDRLKIAIEKDYVRKFWVSFKG